MSTAAPRPRSPERSPGRAGKLTLATFLPYRLNVLASVVSSGLAKTYAERFGIGIPEWRVLATVGEFGSVTAKAIGLHAHMGKVKVSRAAAALESRALIRRVPNQDDLREAFLVMTPAGLGVYREIAALALAYVAELEAVLTPDERTSLDALIEKLLRRAGEVPNG